MTEKEQLASLDKHQRRYLKNFCCGACEFPFLEEGCGSRWQADGSGCSEEVRIRRRENCLKGYKPRLNRRKNGVKTIKRIL